MSFDIGEVLDVAVDAAKDAFGAAWTEAKPIFTVEFKTTLNHLADIGKGLKDDDFDIDTAKILVSMQVNNLIMAIAAATTIVFAAAQKAINTVFDAIKGMLSQSLRSVLPI